MADQIRFCENRSYNKFSAAIGKYIVTETVFLFIKIPLKQIISK